MTDKVYKWPTFTEHQQALAAKNAELAATKAENERLCQAVIAKTHETAGWIMKHNAIEQENAALKARVEELEREIAIYKPVDGCEIAVMKALNPQQEIPHE